MRFELICRQSDRYISSVEGYQLPLYLTTKRREWDSNPSKRIQSPLHEPTMLTPNRHEGIRTLTTRFWRPLHSRYATHPNTYPQSYPHLVDKTVGEGLEPSVQFPESLVFKTSPVPIEATHQKNK